MRSSGSVSILHTFIFSRIAPKCIEPQNAWHFRYSLEIANLAAALAKPLFSRVRASGSSGFGLFAIGTSYLIAS
jgi:hypothetical protein